MEGYSTTPLARKLGVKVGSRLFLIDAPANFQALLEPLPADVVVQRALSSQTDVAHMFVTSKLDLSRQLERLRHRIRPNAAIWISWPKKKPKKAAKVPTDLTEDVIRSVALPLGLVDIKVCAVDEVWSGLKLVIRKELRSSRS